MTGSYISEKAKQQFSIRVGIWGVVFFMGQFIVPVIAMFAIMGPLMLFTTTSMKVYNLDEAAPYRDGILTIVKKGFNEHNSLVYEQEHESEKIMDHSSAAGERLEATRTVC